MCFSKFSIEKFSLLSSKIILNAENVLSTSTDVTGQYLKCFDFDGCTFTWQFMSFAVYEVIIFLTFLFRKRTIVHSFVSSVNGVGKNGWARIKAGISSLYTQQN